MESFVRRQLQRKQAKAKAAEVRKRQAANRTGQVVRSTVNVGDETVPLDDLFAGSVETGARADDLGEAVEFLDQDQADSVDNFIDGNGVDVGDVLDASELVDETVESDVDRWDENADNADAAHEAAMTAIAAAQAVNQALADANAAAQAAADAQSTADGKNSRRRGVTEPAPPEGGWVQGDQWVRDEDRAGVMVPVQVLVWNGTAFVPEQIIADDILVIGEDGTIRLKNGVVTAPALAVDALNFKSAQGMELLAAVITGSTVRTAASGQRTQLDAFGLRTFNSSNAETSRLGATNDGMEIKLAGTRSVSMSADASYAKILATAGSASGGIVVGEVGGDLTISTPVGNVMLAAIPGKAILDSSKPLTITARTTMDGNTFALKSQLDAWTTAIDGTHAWVTAEGREYVRAGGVWKLVWGLTAWQTLAVATGMSGSIRYRLNGNDVEFRFDISGINASGDVAYSAAIPAAFRPPEEATPLHSVNAYIDPAAARPSAVLYMSAESGILRGTAGGGTAITRVRGSSTWKLS